MNQLTMSLTNKAFGGANEKNGNWIRLESDLREWENLHPHDLFISPKRFKILYPYYEIFSKQSFGDAYFTLLEKRCKLLLLSFY